MREKHVYVFYSLHSKILLRRGHNIAHFQSKARRSRWSRVRATFSWSYGVARYAHECNRYRLGSTLLSGLPDNPGAFIDSRAINRDFVTPLDRDRGWWAEVT